MRMEVRHVQWSKAECLLLLLLAFLRISHYVAVGGGCYLSCFDVLLRR